MLAARRLVKLVGVDNSSCSQNSLIDFARFAVTGAATLDHAPVATKIFECQKACREICMRIATDLIAIQRQAPGRGDSAVQAGTLSNIPHSRKRPARANRQVRTRFNPESGYREISAYNISKFSIGRSPRHP